MKKYLENIRAEAEQIRLSESEKAAMRAAIFGAPSPVQLQRSPYVFASIFSSHQFRMVMAGLLLFVIVGGSTASAAQNALPGDLLYPVKLSVTEKVETALASTPADKAVVEAALAERRVEEAQSLAAEGRLTTTVAAELAARFDEHAESAQALADEVEGKEPGTAVQIKTKLSSSLSVHGAVLQRIGRGSKDKNTKEESFALGARVIARADGPAKVAAQARSFAAPAAMSTKGKEKENTQVMAMAVSEDARSRSEAGNEKIAAYLQEKASESLTDATKLFQEIKTQLDATSSAALQEGFSSASMHMSAGAVALGAQDYSLAQQEFTEALRISAQLSALLFSEKKFDNGLLKGLLEDNRQGEDGVRVNLEF